MRASTRRCTLINRTRGVPLCAEVRIAETFFRRLVGLLAHRELRAGQGLWLQPSTGIHTLGMRFAIDVVALDREGKVLKYVEHVKPWRVVGMPRKTRSVVELPAGHLRAHPIGIGDLAFPAYL